MNTVAKNTFKSGQKLSPAKMEKTAKQYLLETLRLMSKNKLWEAKETIETVLQN